MRASSDFNEKGKPDVQIRFALCIGLACLNGRPVTRRAAIGNALPRFPLGKVASPINCASHNSSPKGDNIMSKRKDNSSSRVIFRRYRRLRNGRVLDAYDYGLTAWPIRIN